MDNPHNRLIIVSNRLPYRIEPDEREGFAFTRTVGGLVAGLEPLHAQPGNVWLGWADEPAGLDDAGRARFERALAERSCAPVRLDGRDAELYYEASRTPRCGRSSTGSPSIPASTRRRGRPTCA